MRGLIWAVALAIGLAGCGNGGGRYSDGDYEYVEDDDSDARSEAAEEARQAVYQDPSILRVINEQKALGLYARITTEMDRLKTLGHLQGVPFLQAYKAVGDMLHDKGLLRPEPQKQPDPTPVETRVATPAPKVVNNEKAAAASPTKATPAAPKQEPNFLDLPDDQFLKQMQGRL